MIQIIQSIVFEKIGYLLYLIFRFSLTNDHVWEEINTNTP